VVDEEAWEWVVNDEGTVGLRTEDGGDERLGEWVVNDEGT
jgi:hypothetical protein